jgi:glycosyltransferase involved in cell wall biosynthesis
MILPKISIVIPSYNKVRYIKKTLDSIFDQKYENLEVIIQDGGSTDGSLEIIKNYLNKYPKITKLESKKDNGQLDAINKGLKKVTGDIVTFINADDMYENEAFKTIANYYIENPNALWFVGKGIVVNNKDIEIVKLATIYKNLLLFKNKYNILLTTNYLMQPSVFLIKKAYEKYGPFMGTNDFVMEYDLWLKIGKNKMPVTINKNLSKFRIEKSTKTKRLFNEILKKDEEIIKKYSSNKFIFILHKLHNIGRILIGNFI